MYFPLQHSSSSCLPLFAIIRRSSIYWSRRHTIPCLIIFLQKRQKFVRRSKTLSTCTRQCFSTLTLVFSGGLAAQKSAGSFKDLSKLSSTLQHHLIPSEWAIASGDSLVGSFVPSYLKAGCFWCWSGRIWRLTKEKIMQVTPLFFQLAMALSMHSTCLPPGPVLEQFSWT